MQEQQKKVVVPQPIEGVLDNLDDDLDRVELWTAALSCFQHPAPEYQPGNVGYDGRKGTVRSAGRSMKVSLNTGSSLGKAVRNTFENQPYIAITIALGLGWLLGRMHRSL
jgi:hypothetical protein